MKASRLILLLLILSITIFFFARKNQVVEVKVKYMFYACEFCGQFKIQSVKNGTDQELIGHDVYIEFKENKLDSKFNSLIKAGDLNTFWVKGIIKPKSFRETLFNRDLTINGTWFKQTSK